MSSAGLSPERMPNGITRSNTPPLGEPNCRQKGLRTVVRACLGESLRNCRPKAPIVGVGGSAFWHGLLGLDEKGRPLTPVFMWADGRAAEDAARLRDEFDERKILAQTGCMLRASFWPAKLRWLRRTNRPLFQKVRHWVSPVDWTFRENIRRYWNEPFDGERDRAL
jgi:Sugar (pentulose and hexulose) kinases